MNEDVDEIICEMLYGEVITDKISPAVSEAITFLQDKRGRGFHVYIERKQYTYTQQSYFLVNEILANTDKYPDMLIIECDEFIAGCPLSEVQVGKENIHSLIFKDQFTGKRCLVH